jgi:hypothetical protein
VVGRWQDTPGQIVYGSLCQSEAAAHKGQPLIFIREPTGPYPHFQVEPHAGRSEAIGKDGVDAVKEVLVEGILIGGPFDLKRPQ